MIVWLTGNSGSGKSTIADNYRKDHPEAIVLHGDDCRDVWPGLGFSKEDRFEQNRRVARLAKMLSDQGRFVIVAVIAPFPDIRKLVDEICSPFWIHVKRKVEHKDDRPYEAPTDAPVIDNDAFSEEGAVAVLNGYITQR